MSRRTIFALMAFGAALTTFARRPDARPLLVWNATASAPLGFYRIAPARPVRVGDLVLLRPDTAAAALYAARGYLPLGVPLLKPVAATAGMHVCEHDGRLSISGKMLASAQPADGKGRPLAAWSDCRSLAAGEVFVLNPAVPTSLDGRYFGPSPLSAVIGRALPLWTWSGR